MAKSPKIRVRRDLKPGIHKISEVFHDLEGCEALEKIFGGRIELRKAIAKTKALIMDSRGYMRVSDEDGTVIINRDYLRKGNSVSIYLDIIHELAHVKQYIEGRELYDKRYSYVDRPTEIEAYQVVVEEARRLGMSEEEIKDHLKVEWISEEEHERLARRLGLKV